MPTQKPTKIELAAEIKKLREMKPTVRRFSAFGDDHHKSIDLQIQVLSGEIEEETIDDMESDDYSLCTEALSWKLGRPRDGEGPPSAEWESLVTKNGGS